MALLTDADIKRERGAKKLNFNLQGLSALYSNKYGKFLEKADATNRYNKYTSRLETLKSGKHFGLISLVIATYQQKNSVQKERIERDDYIVIARDLEENVKLDLFLRNFIGDPMESIFTENRFFSISEEYLFMLSCNPTKKEWEEYVEKFLSITDISYRDLNHFNFLNHWFSTPASSPILKKIEDISRPKYFIASKMNEQDESIMIPIHNELKEAFMFWSSLLPFMNGSEGKNFKQNYRQYYIPKDSFDTEMPTKEGMAQAISNAISAFAEMSGCVRDIDCPFNHTSEVAQRMGELIID